MTQYLSNYLPPSLTDEQTRTVINEFMAIEEHLQALILDRYHNPDADKLCRCNNGFCEVRCRWDGCLQYPTSCERCFVKDHVTNPLHWALVWDKERGIWLKKDFSELLGEPFIQLGHVGEEECCPNAKGALPFIITHTNGVHSTKIQYCGCSTSATSQIDQLIHTDLFPATTRKPESAFTLASLKYFRMHNMQSKCGAFDWIMSIRRLTNNTFTEDVSVSVFVLMVSGTQLICFRIPTKASFGQLVYGRCSLSRDGWALPWE